MRQFLLPMRVWDLPIRLFHWALVGLVLTSWASAQFLWMRTHMACGTAIACLLLFRVLWGFAGSDTARFSRFLASPFRALGHLAHLFRREPDFEVGHNPAGGWMALVLLLILMVQVGTGLCANDDALTEGPLAEWVGKDRSDWLTHIHHLNFMLIEAAVALHILAILAYRVLKGQNLVLPMISGKKRLPAATRAPAMGHSLVAAGLLAASVAVVLLSLRFLPR